MTHLAEMGGEIRVRLTDVAGRIGAVEIVSTRPVEAARIFEAQTAEAMCGAIGRVFSLCGKAQTVAALTAVEAGARDRARPACSRRARRSAPGRDPDPGGDPSCPALAAGAGPAACPGRRARRDGL